MLLFWKKKKYEKELFGNEYEDGTISFGILEKANKGTLLIDEISEMPLDTQANILRLIIDQRFKRIRGSEDISVNIRIICSTSKNLKTMVLKKEFREDLYHRINVVPLELPSLQSRTEDIPLLINYFKKKIAEINGVSEININTDNELLYTYNWPGNIRELRNLIERITILSVNEKKTDSDKLLTDILSQKPLDESNENIINNTMSYSLKEAREKFEKQYLSNQLKINHGNISKTAESIGMERSALHRKLKFLGIKGIN